ncbi:MAG TPA: tetratricopeptide repeat protein [Bryobacteraceae bacterium]|nr:tetratricopeptide repeat protein [Bryobacteraceae bacterium]
MSTLTLPQEAPAAEWNQLEIGRAFVEASEHLKRGEDESALGLLEKVVQHAPDVPVFLYLLGVTQVRRKLHAPAVANLKKALGSDENNTDYLTVLGAALTPERPVEAISCLFRAVELGSRNHQTYSMLADLLLADQKANLALLICQTGQAICGDRVEILRSGGLALKMLGRAEEALHWLQKAEQLNPADTTTLISVASVLLDLGLVHNGTRYLERAVALDPENATAHYNLGFALLLEGNYQAGFREYEARWMVRELVPNRVTYPTPLWDGSELKGLRILLHAEQGAGDTIQFVRYARLIQERGAAAILLVNRNLTRLLSWCEGCEIAPLDAPLPAHDLHCSLLSLPQRFGTDRDTIPAPAIFDIPAEMKQKWSEILGAKTRLRVGLVWAGSPMHRNDRNRSLSFRLFSPIVEVAGADYFGLQVGPAAAEQTEPGIQHSVRDLAAQLTDYAETAAAISQLDLVITADTSVAHLAGSVNTPVWVLIPFAPDWRWLAEREDSPWYPSMRLFRQRVAGDWESVIASVAAKLRYELR